MREALARFFRPRGRRAAPEPKTDEARTDIGFMYAMHAAFRRDIARLRSVVGAHTGERSAMPSTVVDGWDVFRRNLTFHHGAEDDDLWPVLRNRIKDLAARDAIDDMVREHGLIPPALDAVSGALEGGADRGPVVEQLATLVLDHLDDEERRVLPLVERHLSDDDWHAFLRTERYRREKNERGEFLCWVLDDAAPGHADAVLRELPAPGRLYYRRVLKPRYEARHLWAIGDDSGPRTGPSSGGADPE